MKYCFSFTAGSSIASQIFAGFLFLTVSVANVGAATEISASEVVRNTTEQVLGALRKEGNEIEGNSERLYKLVDELILPHFDFIKMSRWVLGRHWRKATPTQQTAFTEQFQGLLVRTYAQALIDFRDQEVEILPMEAKSGETVVVRSQISQEGGATTPITYKMHMKDKVWKVYDVSIDGVSLVINYRASFNQEIKRNGIDELIKRLAAHNSKNT